MATKCSSCGCKSVPIVFEIKYNGLRGKCPECKSNWPES